MPCGSAGASFVVGGARVRLEGPLLTPPRSRGVPGSSEAVRERFRRRGRTSFSVVRSSIVRSFHTTSYTDPCGPGCGSGEGTGWRANLAVSCPDGQPIGAITVTRAIRPSPPGNRAAEDRPAPPDSSRGRERPTLNELHSAARAHPPSSNHRARRILARRQPTLDLETVLTTSFARSGFRLDGGVVFESTRREESRACEPRAGGALALTRRATLVARRRGARPTAITLEPVQVADSPYRRVRESLRATHRIGIVVPRYEVREGSSSQPVVSANAGSVSARDRRLAADVRDAVRTRDPNARCSRIHYTQSTARTRQPHKSEFLASMSHELGPLNAIWILGRLLQGFSAN